MSRTMPSECPHGCIYDWGDFGCECGPAGTCEQPDAHRRAERCAEGCNDWAFTAAVSTDPEGKQQP